MKLAQSLFFITAATLLSGCIVIATPSHANYHSQQKLIIDGQALTLLAIETGAGLLDITGSDTASDITLVADIYTDKSHRDNYQLELTTSGQSGYLLAQVNSSGFWQGESPHIDLKVTIPSHLMLKVNDGSGLVNISHINNAIEIKDGSGELTIKDINGDLDINDGSGSLYVSGVIGNVVIVDGSGKIELNDLDGNLDINDGSGSIFAKGISGRANIDDGSGDLTVRNVAGLVTINDGTGDIDVAKAGGLNIIASGSGDLRVEAIKGVFSVGE